MICLFPEDGDFLFKTLSSSPCHSIHSVHDENTLFLHFVLFAIAWDPVS